MKLARVGVVREQRLVAVDGLQHQEVGELRGAAAARRRHASGQRFPPLVQQAEQLAGEGRQPARRADMQDRRDEILVEDDLPVRAAFDDVRERDAGVGLCDLVGQQKPRPQRADFEHRRIAAVGRIVASLEFLHFVTDQFVSACLAIDFQFTGAAQRDRQIEQLIAHIGANVQRLGQRIVVGHPERCAVGKNAGHPAQRHLADAQKVRFEFDFRKAPAVRDQRLTPRFDVTLDVALRLKSKLEMSGQYQILLVRGDESFVALRERAVYANDRNVDLFISIHVNYLPGTSTNAVQTYYFGQFSDAASRRTAERENQRSQYTVGEFEGLAKTMANEMKLQESMALAHSIQQSLVSNLRNKNEAVLDTGVRSAPFVVLLGVKAPSVLAEIGSLSSVEAEERLRRDEYRDEIASYLASGISNYLSDTPTGATHYVESEKQPTTYR